MARSKLKKKQKSTTHNETEVDTDNKIPIPNLPEKCLLMKVKSGTKIRNVLEYSLKQFPSQKCVVWTGAGQAIGKVISCVEIFKRKQTGLHQLTKLRYIQSRNSSEETSGKENRQVPEIHILLSKDILDIKEPGYQAPGACAMFQNSEVADSSDKSNEIHDARGIKTRRPKVTNEQFMLMGHADGPAKKKPKQDNPAETPSKKNTKGDDNEGN